MAHHRFYAPPESWTATEITLSADETHHAKSVLRLAVGDEIQVFDGAGQRAQCRLLQLEKSGARAEIVSREQSPTAASRLLLAQAIPKGKTMEWIVEKAVELGAAGVIPLITDRTVVRLEASEAKQKQQKWQRVAMEACKQCGQDWMPHIALPQSLTDCLTTLDTLGTENLGIVAALTPQAVPIRTLTRTWQAKPAHCTVFVGPEGDFSPKEMDQLLHHGCTPVTLGKIILRAETAALYCLSVFQHELIVPTRVQEETLAFTSS